MFNNDSKSCGWLLLDKPSGMTSARALAPIKRALSVKVGHAGTLDPFATGLLLVAIGEATKLIELTMNYDKSYEFTVAWGEERDTDDLTGQVIKSSGCYPTAAAVEQQSLSYRGEITQMPPNYSALKVKGLRAYKLARQGIQPCLAARRVNILELSLLEQVSEEESMINCFSPITHSKFFLHCSKGFYVRALARDLGQNLGSYGHVTQLHRSSVGPFSLNQAHSLAQVEALLSQKHNLNSILLPLATPLTQNHIVVSQEMAKRLACGQAIGLNNLQKADYEGLNKIPVFTQINDQRELVALCKIVDDLIYPCKVFAKRYDG